MQPVYAQHLIRWVDVRKLVLQPRQCVFCACLWELAFGCLVSSSLCCHAAALKMKNGPKNGKLYTEEDWNTDSQADKEGGYMYSKV